MTSSKSNAFLIRLILFSLLSVPALCYAQDGTFNLGGRSAGMAGASLTLGDEFSLFNNIGGLGLVENHAAFTSYQNRFGIREFQVIGGGIIFHHNIGSAGAGYYKFGDDLFSQQRVHLAIGHTLQMVSLGAGIDLIQYNIYSIGSSQVVAFQFGGIAQLSNHLVFGAHVFNFNQAELGSETGEKIPTTMKGGFSYRPSNELMLNLEVEKDLDFEEVFKAGIEYQIVNRVFVRTGISTEPFLAAFGVGFHPKQLKFDYAFSNDSRLGSIHEVSISYIRMH